MSDQSVQMAGHRRSVRSYGGVSGRSRQRQARSQEQVRLVQLAVCLILFLFIFLWKGAFPQKLIQVRTDLFTLISTDYDFREALSSLGESLAEEGTVLSDLGAFCVEVFGGAPAEEEQKPQQTAFIPPKPAGVMASELEFLGESGSTAVRTAHYADFSRFGVALPERPQDQPSPPETEQAAAPEEPPAVPAAGTLVAASDYSGDPLPNNYTMDQLSLGELETMNPVLGRLNSDYGYRDHPIDGKYHFHGGVDIGGQMGDPIGAFAAGTVEYVGEDDSYGMYLQVDHGNGVKSFYAHCSRIVVTKGQAVEIGEKVAEIGSTGSATGPHLHLELKYNKMHLNPAYYVEFL